MAGPWYQGGNGSSSSVDYGAILTALNSGQSYNHRHEVTDIQDLPSLDALNDLGNKTGSIGINQVAGLATELANIRALLGTASGSAPANSVVGTITGTATVGSTLTLTAGTWTGSPTSYEYKWYIAGVGLLSSVTQSGTSTTITVPSTAGGKSIYATVDGINAAGLRGTSTTLATAISAPSTVIWTEGTASAAVDAVIKAMAIDSTGANVFTANTVITGGGGGTPTAPAPVGTVVTPVFHNGGAATVTFTPPAAAVGTGSKFLIGAVTVDTQDASTVFTQPTGWSTPISVKIGGGDGTQLYVTYLYEATSVAASYTGSISSGSAYKWTPFCDALSNVKSDAVIEWSATGSSATGAASPVNMSATGGTTSYDNTCIYYISAPDTYGAGLNSGNAPPAGFTERVDANGATYDFAPITAGYKVFATAGAIGTVTPVATLSSGTSGYATILLAIRGATSSGALSAAGSIKTRTFNGTWGSNSNIYTSDSVEAAADEGWFQGLAVSSDGNQMVIAAGQAGFIGPGYTLCYDRALDSYVQRFEGSFDTSATGSSNGSVAIADGGKTIVSVYVGTDNKLWTYDGSGFGDAYPSPYLNSVQISLTSPQRGNSIALNAAGTKMAVIDGNRIGFYARTGISVPWSFVSYLNLNGINPVGMAVNRNWNTIVVGTSAGAEVYQGSESSWSLSQLITVTAGRTNIARCCAISNLGDKIFVSEDSATDCTGSLASAFAPQKQYFIRVFTN